MSLNAAVIEIDVEHSSKKVSSCTVKHPAKPVQVESVQNLNLSSLYGTLSFQESASFASTTKKPFSLPSNLSASYPLGYNPEFDLDGKSKIAAGFLGIFGGALGLHRFYTGHKVIGFLFLLVTVVGSFFTAGLAALLAGSWGLVEGVLYLAGFKNFACDAKGSLLKS